jgi:hypothetical protein
MDFQLIYFENFSDLFGILINFFYEKMSDHSVRKNVFSKLMSPKNFYYWRNFQTNFMKNFDL